MPKTRSSLGTEMVPDLGVLRLAGRLPLTNQERQQDGRHSSKKPYILINVSGFDSVWAFWLFHLSFTGQCSSDLFQSTHNVIVKTEQAGEYERLREPTWPGKALGRKRGGRRGEHGRRGDRESTEVTPLPPRGLFLALGTNGHQLRLMYRWVLRHPSPGHSTIQIQGQSLSKYRL